MNAIVNRIIAKLKAWGPDKCIAGVLAGLLLLVIVQGVRYGVTIAYAKDLTDELRSSALPPPARDGVNDFEHFKPILDKGILGAGDPPKGAPPPAMLYGIMGQTALIGNSPNDAKPYEAGVNIASGDKLIEVGTDFVIIEKDGEKRTVTIFDALGTVKKKEGPVPPRPREEEKEPPPEMVIAGQQAPQVAIAPPSPAAWTVNAQTIIGTRWSFQGMSASFYDNGKVMLNDELEGTYSIDGDAITVEIGGETVTAQIDGDSISVEGQATQRDQ